MSIGNNLLPENSYNLGMDWYEWILKKYIEFRGDATGHERSITDFANAIGISQPLMAQWMKKGGKKPRNASSLNHLVAYFGYDQILFLNLFYFGIVYQTLCKSI